MSAGGINLETPVSILGGFLACNLQCVMSGHSMSLQQFCDLTPTHTYSSYFIVVSTPHSQNSKSVHKLTKTGDPPLDFPKIAEFIELS